MPEASRLYLITPKLDAGQTFLPHLEAVLAATDVACVLIRAMQPDERSLMALAGVLAPRIQAAGAAALVEGAPRLAARLGLDGIHVNGSSHDFEEALDSLKPDRIVGIGDLAGRDAAMVAGERGADYLMFGGPDRDNDAVLEETTWWAHLFTVPCVAYAASLADAEALQAAGAEFVALCDGLWDAPEGPALVARRVVDRLAAAAREPVA